MDKNNYQEKDWNFNDAWYSRLNENFKDCDLAAKQGKTIGLFRSLNVVFKQMHWRMKIKGSDEEERIEADMKNNFEKAKTMLKAGNANVLGAVTEAEQLLMKIYEQLSDLIYEYDFIKLKTDKRSILDADEEGAF